MNIVNIRARKLQWRTGYGVVATTPLYGERGTKDPAPAVHAAKSHNHRKHKSYPTYLIISLLGLGGAGGLVGGLLGLFLLLLLGAATEHGEHAVRGLHSGILGSIDSLLSGLGGSLSDSFGGRLLALTGGGSLLGLGLSDGGGVGLGLGDVRHDDGGGLR